MVDIYRRDRHKSIRHVADMKLHGVRKCLTILVNAGKGYTGCINKNGVLT
jgi:hypothetical protein